MNVKKEYIIEILDKGIIQLLVRTIYTDENGAELARQNWRTTLEPGQYDEVAKLGLDEYRLKIIRAAWTDEVVELYQQKIESDQATLKSGF